MEDQSWTPDNYYVTARVDKDDNFKHCVASHSFGVSMTYGWAYPSIPTLKVRTLLVRTLLSTHSVLRMTSRSVSQIS